MSYTDYKSIEIGKVHVSARHGSSVGECIRDAILLAVKEWRNVELVHNQKVYQVIVNDLLCSVKEDKYDMDGSLY